jgi:hypothetical protein
VPIYRVAEREPDLEAAYFALHGREIDATVMDASARDGTAVA